MKIQNLNTSIQKKLYECEEKLSVQHRGVAADLGYNEKISSRRKTLESIENDLNSEKPSKILKATTRLENFCLTLESDVLKLASDIKKHKKKEIRKWNFMLAKENLSVTRGILSNAAISSAEKPVLSKRRLKKLKSELGRERARGHMDSASRRHMVPNIVIDHFVSFT